jgi:hypothetical protein
MLHVLLGDSMDIESLLDANENSKPIKWIVPKTAHVGDRALFHVPVHGFVARGVVASEPRQLSLPGFRSKPYRISRWRAKVRDLNLLSTFVPLAFIRHNHPNWKWPTYPRKYTTIDGAVEARLEELLGSYQASVTEPLTEGASKSASVTVYERNPIARQQCIAHYGTACHACGFSFGETYGQTAEGFIQVHHLKAVSTRGGKYTVDPVRDLRPICPNCHAVIHLQAPPLSTVELKRMLKGARSRA